MEQVISAAERRAISNGETKAILRVTDLFYMVPALTGKLELVYEGEQEGAVNVAKHLLGKAIRRAFLDYFEDPSKKQVDEKKSESQKVLDWFADGETLDIPDLMSEKEYRKALDQVDGLKELVESKSTISGNHIYSTMDLVIEALHQFSKLGKEDLESERSYSDMLGSMLGGMGEFDDDDFDL